METSLRAHIEKYKLSKIRLYLLTKRKSSFENIMSSLTATFDSDEDDLLDPLINIPYSSSNTNDNNKLSDSTLIGTNMERESLRNEITSAYEESA